MVPISTDGVLHVFSRHPIVYSTLVQRRLALVNKEVLKVPSRRPIHSLNGNFPIVTVERAWKFSEQGQLATAGPAPPRRWETLECVGSAREKNQYPPRSVLIIFHLPSGTRIELTETREVKLFRVNRAAAALQQPLLYECVLSRSKYPIANQIPFGQDYVAGMRGIAPTPIDDEVWEPWVPIRRRLIRRFVFLQPNRSSCGVDLPLGWNCGKPTNEPAFILHFDA